MKPTVFILFTAISLCLGISPLYSAETKEGSYKIAIGDVINIQIYQEPDLSGDFEVKEDGTITYPLLGSVKVLKSTKSEIENRLTELLGKDYLVTPYLHVSITTYHERSILILGCVQKAGSYSFPQNNSLTLLQAISLAGGFTGYAGVNGTKVIRTSADGKKVVIDPHLNDIIAGRKKDVDLIPNDLIVVPERLF